MSDYDINLDRLTRRISRGSNSSSIRLPRAPQMSMHMGILTEVDNNTNSAHFAFNDPSGLILPGVRVMQTYGGTNQPEPGHIVFALHNGTDFMIWGQHFAPPNLVIP